MDESFAAPAQPAGMFYGIERLRRFGRLSSSLARHENTELVLAFAGDSWVRGSGLPAQGDPARVRYFMPGLCAQLQQRYGDAGGGWCGLSYATSRERRGGSANSNRLYQEGVGAWTTHVNNRPVPDLCTSVSRVPGDSIRVTNTTGPTRAVYLHYLPGGMIEYRWNGGTWCRLALSAAGNRHGCHVAALQGYAPVGAWTLDLRVVSGMVELAGIEHRSGQPGIRMHNLGAGGSGVRHWSDVDARAWARAFEAFGCDTVLALFGTNDQKHITPDAHRQGLRDWIGTLRRAAPDADIALVTSPESGDNSAPRPTRPMRLYSSAARSLAVSERLCHVDLQAAFGELAAYRTGGTQPLLDASLIHPNTAGSRVLEALFLRLFEQARNGPWSA